MQQHPLKLIVGLGNPGPQYQYNRHNAGAWYLQALCHAHGDTLRPESRFFGETARIIVNGQDIRLLFPTTYMNRSGQSVGALCRYFGIDPENMLVAYDEIDFPPGTSRLKFGGGHGGHNGIRDIIQTLGGNRDFYRLRIGVGHPGNKAQVANYVLSNPPASEAALIESNIDDAVRVTADCVAGKWQQAMQTFHGSEKLDGDRKNVDSQSRPT